MKHSILSIRAGTLGLLALSMWLFFAATAHAQPGPGYALRIDNTASYVAVPQAVGLNSFPFTVMAWVNTTATSGQQGLVNKYVAGSQNGWNLFLLNGNVRAWYFASNTRFVWDGADGLNGGSIANGQWHHIAFTVDGTGGRLYVDGVLRASRVWTGSSGPPSTAQEMRFGNYPGGVLSFFGSISLDEITVWNAGLSISQVQANMFTPLVGNEANLVALYRCNESGGTSVADSAALGGSNNGAWVGTPVFVNPVVAPQAASDGGSARGDCSSTPGVTEVKLEWRGQNVVGCKVDLDWSGSRIRRVAPDCTTIYTADLPSSAPKRWTILSQPIGSDIDVEVTATTARLPLVVPGNYIVQLEVCPGDCVVPGPDGNNFPMRPAVATITIRAEAELSLRAQERPVLPPSAMVPTPRLALSQSERACIAIGGGGFINPQWVTVESWNGPNDYKLVEGAVVSAWPSTRASLLNHDLAINDGGDWYAINDVSITVSPDPRHFNLLTTPSIPIPPPSPNSHLLTCEAQYDSVPDRFCPVEGDRISLWGFWVIEGGNPRFDTAIHPAVGWAVHRSRPVRIPDTAMFTFDLHSNTVVSAAGNNLFVPGVVSDLWFNSDAGGAIRSAAGLASSQSCTCHHEIVTAPIQRSYDFNIYLPKNPGQVFAEVGIAKPRAPLHVSISNPYGSPGPDPTYTRMTETVNGVTYEYLRVHLDLNNHSHSNYSRRIEAAWVYPKADNWGLEQWRVSLDKLDVYDDLDSKLRFPGSDGDWVLWMMLPGAEQSWTRVRDGVNNTHGTTTFSPAWQTGSADPVLQRAPLSLDPGRRLGPDVLTFNRSVNFWLGGFEADEADGEADGGAVAGGDRGDPGRISGAVFNSGHSNILHSHNDVFSATVTGTRVAIHSNGVLSVAATALGRQYLLNCTNRLNDRTPVRDSIDPSRTPGLLVEGISSEAPLSPVDPQQLYGGGAALLDDVDGDGFQDVALGLRHSNAVAHIFLGGRNGFAPASFATVSIPLVHSNILGPNLSLVAPRDFDGDRIGDLLVGAPTFVHSNAVGGVHSNAGTVFGFSGAQLRAGGNFAHSNALWTISSGTHSNAQFGFSVAAGDVNGDGLSDVVVGAPFHSNSVAGRLGRVFVYFGSPGIHSNTPPSQVLTAETAIGGSHWFGYSVTTASDVNRDGYTDVLVGAPRYSRTIANQGAAYLFYGSPTGLHSNSVVRLEGFDLNAQFGFSVAGTADVDGDGFSDALVGAPFSSGSELTLENGYVALYRGSAGGLISTAAWLKYGETGGLHSGTDVGPVGDLNGDGRGDFAIATPDESNPDGLRGRVTYFLGHSNTTMISETFRTWGANAIAKSRCDNTNCCISKNDFNLDGFTDALTFSTLTHSSRVDRVRLTLGRGLKTVQPTTERFFRAGESSPFSFQSIFHSNFVANLVASDQTMEMKHSNVLARVQNVFQTVQQAGGSSSSLVPMLQRLQNVHSNLSSLGFVHSNLFNQVFAQVDLDLGTAFYIDCGETTGYTDTLGRRWLPDASFLATSSSAAQLTVFAGIGPITNTLTGDRYLPDAMLNSERWFNGHIRYQVGVPNGFYTVILYFSENYPPGVNTNLGGTGPASAARIFDLEVEGQRVNAYNQADAALPPAGDGLGRLYTATQVRFDVQVSDGLVDIGVLDRGPGNPPENSAIKGFAILARPNPATKFAARPRVASPTRNAGQLGVFVDPQSGLARYFAGETPMRLQSTSNFTQWATLPNLPEVGLNGALFTLPPPTNRASFLRAVVSPP